MVHIKKMWDRHWNCLPWFVCGLSVFVEGDIGRFEYGLIWMSLLILLWNFCPATFFKRKSLEEKERE